MAKRIFVMLISTAIALAGVFAEEEPVKMPEDVPANVLEDKPADEAADTSIP